MDRIDWAIFHIITVLGPTDLVLYFFPDKNVSIDTCFTQAGHLKQ